MSRRRQHSGPLVRVGLLPAVLCAVVTCAVTVVDTGPASATSPLVTVLPDSAVAGATANQCASGTPLAVRGVVFDQNGDAFVSDTGTAGGGTCTGGSDHGGIWEIPYEGSNTWGTAEEVIAFSSGNQPNGLAINSSGDLFVADNGTSTVYEFVKQGVTGQGYAQFVDSSCPASTTAPNASCFQQLTVGTTGTALIGLATAPDGSLYFADRATGFIEHAVESSGTWTLTSTGITIAADTYAGFAVSGSGNLFYDDYSVGRVYEAAANGSGGFNTPVTLASTASNGANYLAVDTYGNVFFVDSQNSSLYEVPLSAGGTYGTATQLLTGLASYAVGMGIDSLDHFYVQNSNWDLEEYGTPLQTQATTTVTVTSSPPPTTSSGPGGTYTVDATPNTGPNTSTNTTITVSIDPATSANCSAQNLTVTFLASGTCIVDITRGGDGSYAPYQTSQTFLIGSGETAPGAPTGLTATVTAGVAQIDLSWTAPVSDGGSPVTGYQVFRGTSPGGELSTPLATAATTSYTDTAVSPGVDYYYTVRAVNSVGASSSSAEASALVSSAQAGGARLATDAGGNGYWVVGGTGAVTAFGAATPYGSETGKSLNAPIVGISATPDGKGYWLVAADGGVFTFGDAAFYGSEGGKRLNAPIVGISATPDGKGYWLVAADGGVFSFGDAAFDGSEGGTALRAPVVDMAPTPDGKGYWLVAADGGVFTFGDAAFYGSEGGKRLNAPIVGMAPTPAGMGYWLVAADGGVFSFGGSAFFGSAGGRSSGEPLVGMIAGPAGSSYELVNAVGGATSFPA